MWERQCCESRTIVTITRLEKLSKRLEEPLNLPPSVSCPQGSDIEGCCGGKDIGVGVGGGALGSSHHLGQVVLNRLMQIQILYQC